MVYNQHPTKITDTVEWEFNLPDFKTRETYTQIKVYQDGKQIPAQAEKERSGPGYVL